MTRGPRVVYYRDTTGEWRWRITAANGETIADSSEGYKRRTDAEHGATLALTALQAAADAAAEQ